MRSIFQLIRSHCLDTPASLAGPVQTNTLPSAIEIDTFTTHHDVHSGAPPNTATTRLSPPVDVSVPPFSPQLPDQPSTAPNLTFDTLRQWVNEPGLSALELDERQRAAKAILSAWWPTKIRDKLRQLTLFGRPRLSANLDVRGWLGLRDYSNLTSLPAGLRVDSGLYLDGCTSLASIRADLNVGSLYLNRCTNLTSLPAGLSVGGNLHLNGCTRLTSLPAGLSVGNELSLRGCTSLISLPAGLNVGYGLDLRDCTSLLWLPADLNLGGYLNLSGCTRLTSLPDAILFWGECIYGRTRSIDLTGTGLTQQVRARIQNQSAPGIRFRYSEHHNEQPFEHAWTLSNALNEIKALDLAKALLAWPSEQQSILSRYLERVTRTADYQNVAVRPTLMNRLRALLSAVCDDPAFRSYALSILDDAMQTCGDRVILGLNTVELQLAVKEATQAQGPQRVSALRQLGLSLMKLDIVHAHAAQSCQSLQFVDEVEIYLAYETKLRERLCLPGRTVSMLYSSGVDAQSFEAAAQDAEQQCANSYVVEAFFATWTPWQRHLRQTQAEAFSFEQIKTQNAPTAAPINRPRICAITQEPDVEIFEPVYLGPTDNPRVYEYASLLAWWIEHGKEPAPFGAFTLDKLWRATK